MFLEPLLVCVRTLGCADRHSLIHCVRDEEFITILVALDVLDGFLSSLRLRCSPRA